VAQDRTGVPDDDPHPQSAELASLDAAAIGAHLDAGDLTSAEVVEALVSRVEAMHWLRAVIELAPDALETAERLDAERRAGRRRSGLHGIPILVKDNIDTAAPMHTTAGSLVFGDSSPPADSPLVRVLRDAGAVVLGKTNLSEWANFRGSRSSSGWSAAGGQTRNPHSLDRSPGGSSSGSAAAVAARLAPLAVGTETDGSIICPAAACGIAGLKPTLGLVSRTGIVPIASSQDTAGPMARTVRDLAQLLAVLARATDDGEDALATRARRPSGYDLSAGASPGAAGLRVGVVRAEGYTGYHAPTDEVLTAALDALAGAGAELVDPVEGLAPPSTWWDDELTVLLHEFRVGMEQYLRRRAQGTAGGPARLTDLLAHAEAEPGERADLFPLDLVRRAAATDGLGSPPYLEALDRVKRATREDGLDRLFAQGVDVVVLPAMAPAWPIDHVLGDRPAGNGWSPAAVSGYPSATLPVGSVQGLPVGVAVVGPPWSEPLILRTLSALEDELGSAVTSPVPSFASCSLPDCAGPQREC